MEIKEYISESIAVKQELLNTPKLLDKIEKISDIIVSSYKSGGKVLTAGNGGSAGDAQHIAGELVCKFLLNRPALNAITLTADTSILTSVSNDLGYENSFARQIEAYSKKGDVFIAISTSGNSQNIINAVKLAKKLEVITVGLVGSSKCQLDDLCDYIIKIPSSKTPIIQESQLMVEHLICGLVEEKLFS